MCALRLKQARGCTIQPLPLRGTGDSEKAPDVPKGTEQGTGGGIWILAFSLSIRKITVEMWGFFFSYFMSLGKFWAAKAQFCSTCGFVPCLGT